jgi:glutamate carboxypeptidase
MSDGKNEAAASAWLADKRDDMLDAIRRLVEVNSFTENVAGGRAVGALLCDDTFHVEGLVCDVKPSTRFADHLVFGAGAVTAAASLRAPVALVGHLDTVFPPGVFEGFKRDGDLARGPGVLDMKGGLVVVAWALRAIAATSGLAAASPLRLVVVADEEVGSPEGQSIIAEAVLGASAALVFEAGRKADAIITRRKGTGGMTAVAAGKAAHAGAAHREGANAIWALARFIDLAQKLTDYERGVTINVGKISGGQGKNTVPDRAEALIDLRFESRADGEALVAALTAAAITASELVTGTSVKLEGGIARLPLERTEASAALFHAYAECARASGLGHGEAGLIGGGSDASTTHAMGIASIDGLGPRGVGFHTKDEQIEVASLVPKAQALARFLLSRAH